MQANQLPRKQTGQADAGQRAQRAWLARVSGASWAQAAEVSGYSSAAVCCRAVTRFFGKLPPVDREQQRAVWRERMELLWRQSMTDVSEQRPGAIRSAVAVSQRAAALDGLDEPSRIDLRTPGVEEFNQVIAVMKQLTLAPGPDEGDIFADFEEDDAETVGDEKEAG